VAVAGVRKIGGGSTRWAVDAAPEAKRRKMEERTGRPIKWDVIKKFERRGELRRCEICGTESFGGYWCRPCIHPRWCCECCILLGIPNYETAVYVVEIRGQSGEGDRG